MKKLATILAATCMLLVLGSSTNHGFIAGDKADDFSLKNVDGSMVSLKTKENVKGYILIFTCNHCPFAKMYEDRIIDLHSKYASKGFPVIAINPNDPTIVPDDSFENMQKRAEKKGYPFPYLFDETQSTAKAYGAEKTPHVYVLEKKGNDFYVQYVGAIDNNASNAKKADKKYVEDAVDELLEGRKVTVKESKAIGCSIKWKKD